MCHPVQHYHILCSIEYVDPRAFGGPLLVAGAADDGACDGAELGKVPEDRHGPDVVVVDAVDGYLGPDSIVDWLKCLPEKRLEFRLDIPST